MQLVIQVKG